MTDTRFTIASAVNDDRQLQQNLLLSPELHSGRTHQLLVKRHAPSAALAYNSAIDESENDVIIFVHQDIYLPSGWFSDLRACLAFLRKRRVDWGVLGCFGSRRDAAHGLGRVYTTGMGYHGQPIDRPERVETLDEILLVIRRSSGLRFDVNLPHFHLYGTDLCLSASERGLQNFAFQAFCVHNTNQILILPDEFYECYRYLRRKWTRYLPIYTSCMKISALNGDMYYRRMSESIKRAVGVKAIGETRVDDPRRFARMMDGSQVDAR